MQVLDFYGEKSTFRFIWACYLYVKVFFFLAWTVGGFLYEWRANETMGTLYTEGKKIEKKNAILLNVSIQDEVVFELIRTQNDAIFEQEEWARLS